MPYQQTYAVFTDKHCADRTGLMMSAHRTVNLEINIRMWDEGPEDKKQKSGSQILKPEASLCNILTLTPRGELSPLCSPLGGEHTILYMQKKGGANIESLRSPLPWPLLKTKRMSMSSWSSE
jgi:hypothetical protein